jgi:uncharacterized protein YfkK (UPF0435 family)
MQISKKNIFFLTIIITNWAIGITETNIEISNKIMSAHVNIMNASSDTNLVETRLKNWNKVLDEFKQYVYQNAVANAVLKNTADLVNQIGKQLFNMNTNQLLLNEEQLIKAKDKLEKETFWYKKEQKEDTKKLLLIVIDLLQKTINNLKEKKESSPKVTLVNKQKKLISLEMMGRLGLCKVQPCMLNLGAKNGLNRVLLQMSMAKQIEARCGGLSLINILWTKKYEESGNTNDLTYLHNPGNVQKVLNEIGCGNWVDIKAVKDYINSAKAKGYEVSNIDAISSILALDKNLAEFLFKEEVNTGQKIKNKVKKGFMQDHFFYGIIIGDEEIRMSGVGHYFAFVIIKKENDIQYIVIDSLTDANHLEPDSYRRRRIHYLITQLETGKATNLIPFTRFQPMVADTKIFIDKKLNKVTEDKKLLDQGILNKESFIENNKDDLKNILDQIKQYRMLTENSKALQEEKQLVDGLMKLFQ